MTAPKQSFEPPVDSPVSGEDGRSSVAYQQFNDRVGKALEKLRQAAELMDTLDASPTTTEIATAWNEFRTKLQEIV